MVKLYGREWSRDALQRYTGLDSQLGGVTQKVLVEGRSAGVRVAEFDTGSGLQFTVLLDRGMDIGVARYKGASLVWEAAPGPAGPTYYEPEGLGWLRTFHGGLLATCGLTYVGAPTVDEGEALGLHGRISHLPASNVWSDGMWRNDAYEMWVRGRMRDAVVFGENLTLTRRISASLGESRFEIRDTVANEGYRRTPHQLLYHVNFGFPLLAEGTELVAPSAKVRPRDEVAAPGLDQHNVYEAPIAGYEEQVFYHDMTAAGDGYVTVALVNRGFGGGHGMGVYLRYRQAELPRFTQWKMVGAGEYVTGLEPANCGVEGRDKDRAAGLLEFLDPGEERDYHLEVGVLEGVEAIDAAVAAIRGG